jgi:hypothetical protein
MVEPYVRDFTDPLEGLRWQLEELEGFARVVPPLIDTRWQKVWDEAMSGPGDPEEDPTDAYARAAGPGTGGGFADFGRTVLMASITLGWQAFVDYLALRLAQLEDPRSYRGATSIRDEIALKLTRLSLQGLVKRFKAFGIDLAGLDDWSAIREIQFTRNALVHNHGRYTPEYLEKVETPRVPEDFYKEPRVVEPDPTWLIDRTDIPLSFEYVAGSLSVMRTFAEQATDQGKS